VGVPHETVLRVIIKSLDRAEDKLLHCDNASPNVREFIDLPGG
jgi:hypothetical protein